MRMKDLRRLQERFDGAADRVDRFTAALGNDIHDSDLQTVELKNAIASILAEKTTINDLLPMAAEMAYRLATEQAGFRVVNGNGETVSIHGVVDQEEDDGQESEHQADEEVLGGGSSAEGEVPTGP